MISRLGSWGPQLGVGLVLHRNRQTQVTLRKHQCEKGLHVPVQYNTIHGVSVLLGAALLRRGANIPPPRGRHDAPAPSRQQILSVGRAMRRRRNLLCLVQYYLRTQVPSAATTLHARRRGAGDSAPGMCIMYAAVCGILHGPAQLSGRGRILVIRACTCAGRAG